MADETKSDRPEILLAQLDEAAKVRVKEQANSRPKLLDPKWPAKPRLLGKRVQRLDGPEKVSGRAKYTYDIVRPGMLYGKIVRSPHAHAKVLLIDSKKAESMPGVKGSFVIARPGSMVNYQGDPVIAIAAEREEQARDAARAVAVKYEVLPFAVTEDQAMSPDAPEAVEGPNVRRGRAETSGDVKKGLGETDVVTIEGFYGTPVITHVCLETHGLLAEWSKDEQGKDFCTVWCSTQAIYPTIAGLAGYFKMPQSQFRCITQYMGGGFGSKFGPDLQGTVAAELARKTGRPVKIMLDRKEEHLDSGSRPSAYAKIKAGATKDGKIVAIQAETYGTGGVGRGAGFPFPYIYDKTVVPNVRRVHADVITNQDSQRAMRAPSHPAACFITESMMEDLAAKLNIDPLEFRLKNLPKDFRTPIYQKQMRLGAERIGWAKRHAPGDPAPGPIKRGLGMGLHTWGGGGANNNRTHVVIHPDGIVDVRIGTQDIGTGTRTSLAVIAAETLGLDIKDIHVQIGDTRYPNGQPSGGSTTLPSIAPPTRNACLQALEQLFAKIAPQMGTKPDNLVAADGKISAKDRPGQALTWKQACARLGNDTIDVTAGWLDGLTSGGVAGCQFADVAVDVETGVVSLKRVVAVQDCGLIVDLLTAESQVYGAVVMGLNYALFEEKIMDPQTGIMLNPNMEFYKLAGPSDIPEVDVMMIDMPERGAIGLGEPPTIATAAAIGNAVFNALGVRVNTLPITPMKVIAALESASKGGKHA